MFGTLRYDRESQHAEFIDRTNTFLGDAATEHAACDKCRLTKLRCTGQRSGCDRCKVRGTPCVYSATGTRHSKNSKKRNLSVNLKDRKQKRQRDQGQSQKAPSKPSRRKRVARSGHESTTRMEKDDEDDDKRDQQVTEDLDKPLAARIEHGVMDVEGTSWSHPQIDANFDFPPSPDGMADICLSLDTEFQANTFTEACDIASSIPSGYGEYGHDDAEFDLFTSSTTESPFLTPAFTNPSSSPAATPADINMTYLSHSCGCLGIIVGMLEELDELIPSRSLSTPIFTVSYSTIDDILASLKTQISHAAEILQCTICYSRREHISLLIRVCEMLARLAGRIVQSYQTQTQQHQAYNSLTTADSPPPTPAASPIGVSTTTNVNLANTISLDSIHSRTDTSSSSPDSNNGMFLGRYKTDPSELECLLRVLIGFQLNALTGLLGSVRKSATGTMSMAQMTRLHSTEEMVHGLVTQLAYPISTTSR